MMVHLSIFDLQIVLQAQRYQNIFTSGYLVRASAKIQNVFTSSYLVRVQHCCICTESETTRVSTLYVCSIAVSVFVQNLR